MADIWNRAQPYCSGCYRSANQLLHKNVSLIACANCHLLHHCSDCSDPHSKAICATYQTQNTIEQFRVELFEDTGKASVVACTTIPRSTFKPLAKSAGWYDYYVNISDKAFIKGSIVPDFTTISTSAAQGGAEKQEFEESRRLFLLLGTDTLTMPLTTAAALEDLRLLTQPTLKIHLLGATGREFLAMSSFEEILHLVPTLKTLDITAVGPSSLLHGQGPEGYAPKYDLPCCEACQAQKRKRPLSAYKGLYHDFASSSFYEKPDLIVAFNSGCVDGDDADRDWDRTIRLIVDSGIPALFTTYNPREAWHEQTKMKSLGARFVVQPEKNKWSSLVPMPEFLDEEFEMWYQNYHRYIIKGKQT
jgi:splicing suppressor protein 51